MILSPVVVGWLHGGCAREADVLQVCCPRAANAPGSRHTHAKHFTQKCPSPQRRLDQSGLSGATSPPHPSKEELVRCHSQIAKDTVSERLRRWTRNPLGSARRGSNPLGVVFCAMRVQGLLPRHPHMSCTSTGALRGEDGLQVELLHRT